MKALRAALVAGTLVLLGACLDFTRFEPRETTQPTDAGCPVGKLTCGTRPEDVCATTLGSSEACTGCGDACGSYCATDHCVGPAQLSLGRTFSCARLEDGTVGCWGGNAFAELGADVSLLNRPTAALVPGVNDALSLCTGNNFSCVVTAHGTVDCWGRNLEGELADGTLENRPEPRSVVGAEGALEVGCGHGHACVRMEGGSILCWGNNSNGQLGNGTTATALSPQPVLGLPAGEVPVQMALGRHHTCVRMDSGALYCWGRNQFGQIGDGTGNQRNTAVKVQGGLNDAYAMSAGANSVCVLRDGGNPWCWGDNTFGQLAVAPSSLPARNLPTAIGRMLTNMGPIAVADDTVCNVRSDDTLFCWGANDGGQVGNGSVDTPVINPTPLSGENVSEFAGGAWHFCLRGPSDIIRCWGDNTYGQIGQPPDTVPLKTKPTVVHWQ